MAEKSDDIKQLFSHLGLNPSDYREIRSAPTANATVSEAPRRWSLLQSVPRAANAPIATMRASAPAMQASTRPSVLPSALLAALPQPVPAPVATMPRSIPAAAMPFSAPIPQAPLPPVVSPMPPPPARAIQRDDLASIFQTVGATRVSSLPADELPSIRLTSRMPTLTRPVDLSGHVSAIPLRAASAAPAVERVVPAAIESPVVAPAPANPLPAQGAAVASGRLKLKLGGVPAGQPQEPAESLQDVFRRLASDNHA